MSSGNQIGAVVGGVVGGIAGAFVGMPQLGFAIGWAAGGLIGGALDPPKDQITDLGAAAFPDFNTALRGLTIPVIFGTCRVNSQITWQGNNAVIRNEESSGGKGGGSGGGQRTVNVAYTYKTSMACHLGMAPSPVVLYGGWVNGVRMSDNVMSSIDAGSSPGFGSGSALDSADIEESDLIFDQAVFFSGNKPEAEVWPELNAAVGRDVRWSGTVWLGFGGLSLGAQPNVPQLSWEVGPPAAASVTANQSVISYKNHSAETILVSTAGARQGSDMHGNVWLIPYHGSTNGDVWVYNGTTGALLASHVVADATTAIDVAAGTSWVETVVRELDPFTPNGIASASTYGSPAVALLPDKTRLILHQKILAGGVTPRALWASGEPQADGSIVWKGCCLQNTGPATSLSLYSFNLFDFTGAKDRSSAPVIGTSSFENFKMLVGPTIDAMESGGLFASKLIGSFILTFSSSGTGNSFFNPQDWRAAGVEVGNQAQNVLTLFTLPDETGGTTVYGYLPRVMAEATDASATWFTNTLKPARPNGGLVKIAGAIGPLTMPSILSTAATTVTLADPEIVDAPFIGTDGAAYDYFEDDHRDYATGTTDAGVIGGYMPFPWTEEQADGTWLVIWGHPYVSDPGAVLAGVFNAFLKLRVYSYNPLAGVFRELAKAQGIAFRKDQIPGTTALDNTYMDYCSWAIDRSGDTLILYSNIGPSLGSTGLTNTWIKGTFADLTFGSADVTPPEIIRAILVNAYFGIYPGADIIDEASYDAAVAYCEDQDIKVSTVYKNDESAQRLIELLLACYSGFLTADAAAGRIKFGLMDANTSPVRTIDNSRLIRRNADELPVKTTKGARQDTYNIIRIKYIDRALEYKQNEVEERDEWDEDQYGPRLREFPPRFVMKEHLARRMAIRALWDNLYTRDTHAFHLGWKDCDLEPGDLITLVDSFSNLNQVVRVNRMKETERGVFEVNATQQLAYVPGVAPGSVSSASWADIQWSGLSSSYTSQSSPTARTSLVGSVSLIAAEVFELPYEFETGSTPRLYFGWLADGAAAGANLYLSSDGVTYVKDMTIQPFPIAGRVLTALPAGRAPAYNVEIVLQPRASYSVDSPAYSMNATLSDPGIGGMHAGQAQIHMGDEVLGYESVELVSQNRYRLSRVHRGWGGTVAPAHGSGDLFYKRGSGVIAREYSTDGIGNAFWFKLVPFGFDGREADIASVSAVQYTIEGRYYRPANPGTIRLSPNHRGITKVNAGGASDISVFWPATSRTSGFGTGGAGANAGGFGAFTADNSLGWRVEVVGSGGLVVRSTFVTTPAYTYSNSLNAADNGDWRGNVAFRVTPRNAYGDAYSTAVTSLELFF